MNPMIRGGAAILLIGVATGCNTPKPAAEYQHWPTYRVPSEMSQTQGPASRTDVTPTPAPSFVGDGVEARRPVPLQRPLPPESPASMNEEVQGNRSPATIEEATNTATQRPAPKNFINAVQIYQFEPGAVYEVYTTPGFLTGLHLRPGEELKHVAGGDTTRWLIDIVDAGADDASTNSIWPPERQAVVTRISVLIKPRFPLLQTNLIITTNEREYLIDLKSTEKTYHSAVEWTYPQPARVFPRENATANRSARQRETAVRNYLYSLQAPPGGLPPWAPQAVYDDGHRVYLEFAPSINDMRRPPLYLLDSDGVARMVNYQSEPNRYVVNELFDRAALRLGNERVVIQRTLPRPSGQAARLSSGGEAHAQ